MSDVKSLCSRDSIDTSSRSDCIRQSAEYARVGLSLDRVLLANYSLVVGHDVQSVQSLRLPPAHGMVKESTSTSPTEAKGLIDQVECDVTRKSHDFAACLAFIWSAGTYRSDRSLTEITWATVPGPCHLCGAVTFTYFCLCVCVARIRWSAGPLLLETLRFHPRPEARLIGTSLANNLTADAILVCLTYQTPSRTPDVFCDTNGPDGEACLVTQY